MATLAVVIVTVVLLLLTFWTGMHTSDGAFESGTFLCWKDQKERCGYVRRASCHSGGQLSLSNCRWNRDLALAPERSHRSRTLRWCPVTGAR